MSIVCGHVSVAVAAPATLVADIAAQLQPRASSPHAFLTLADQTLFLASTPTEGEELWRTDGTPAGTRLVKDLEPGVWGSDVRCLAQLDGNAVFVARHPLSDVDPDDVGLVLWRSDGTASGTVALQEMEGRSTSAESGCPFAVLSGRIYFTVQRTDETRALELWRSNGTRAGTTRVIELPSNEGFDPQLTASGSRLYFSANGADGIELWRSDGSTQGTKLVKDLLPGAASSFPKLLGALDDRLLLSAWNGQRYALWRSDGTAQGTVVLADLGSQAAVDATQLGDRLLIRSSDGVYETDGSVEGTRLRFPGLHPAAITPIGDAVWLFTGEDFVNTRILRWSGGEDAPVDAVTVAGNSAYFAAPFAGGFIFTAYEVAGRSVLWFSDGTQDGTRRLAAQLTTESETIGISGSRVFFAANAANDDVELWSSDGSVEGTALLANIAADDVATPPSNPAALTVAAGQLFFTAVDDAFEGRELWRSDGTAGGTRRVVELNNDPFADAPINGLVAFDGALYVGLGNAFRLGAARGLYKSDGTSAGTDRVAEGDSVGQLTVAGNALFYRVSTSSSSVICRLIPSQAAPVCSGPFAQINELVPLGDRVLMTAAQSNFDFDLWVSDGTADGTRRFKDLGVEIDAVPRLLTAVGPYVYFVTGQATATLWRSDGSGAGTQVVRSIDLQPGGLLGQLTAAGDKLFFAADTIDVGPELWVSDGSAAGTHLVRDVNPSSDSFDGLPVLGAIGSSVLMGANDGVHGTELWISDGTADGTRLLRDVYPGPRASHFSQFTQVGARVAFEGCSDLGCEPWITDGTSNGTVPLADIATGIASSYPVSFAGYRNAVYFAADDGLHGYELWRVALGVNEACAGDCDGDGQVAIDDLVTGVAIALGSRAAQDCVALDQNADGAASIDELVAAVRQALDGCR